MEKTDAPPRAPAPRGFEPWAKAHKLELILGGAGLVIAYALYEKSHASSSTQASSGTSASSSPAQDVLYPGSSSTSGELTSLSEQLDQLQQQVSGLTTGTPSAVGAPAPTPAPTSNPSAPKTSPLAGEKQVGSGYGYANLAGFDYIKDPAELSSLEKSGYEIFFQPAPGIFEPNIPNERPNTPQYFNPLRRIAAKVKGK